MGRREGVPTFAGNRAHGLVGCPDSIAQHRDKATDFEWRQTLPQ